MDLVRTVPNIGTAPVEAISGSRWILNNDLFQVEIYKSSILLIAAGIYFILPAP